MTINDDGTILGILLLINNLLPFILFFIGCSILYFSAESFIDNSINISQKLNISPIIIGASVIAIGTSLPELLVSLFSIFKHNTSNDIGDLVSSSIVIGNILGSNIANIFGITLIAIFMNGQINYYELLSSIDKWLFLLVSIVFFIMIIKKMAGKLLSIGLIFAYLTYFTYLYF